MKHGSDDSPLDQPRPSAFDPRLESLRSMLSKVEPAPGAQSDSLSDERAIKDARYFRRRFGLGFSNWDIDQRRELIRLKDELELTDLEIFLFRQTGNLRRTQNGVSFAVNLGTVTKGALRLSTLVAFIAGFIVMISPDLRHASLNVVTGRGIFGLLAALGVGIYILYILPWHVLRNAEQQRAAKHISSEQDPNFGRLI